MSFHRIASFSLCLLSTIIFIEAIASSSQKSPYNKIKSIYTQFFKDAYEAEKDKNKDLRKKKLISKKQYIKNKKRYKQELMYNKNMLKKALNGNAQLSSKDIIALATYTNCDILYLIEKAAIKQASSDSNNSKKIIRVLKQNTKNQKNAVVLQWLKN